MNVPYSVLDLAPIVEGADASAAFRNTLDLARHAERWGYRRYWLAEHHNMPGVASAATSIVIGYVAAGTSSIRVGAGGVMLPNHAPLVIAEQFGTLASLYPGRIDLGLGRAPGTDRQTMHALRREMLSGPDAFPQDVVELQAYFRPAVPDQAVRAVPGAGLDVPIWLLGSSLFSAQLAAFLGLPFAFASHFAPALLMEAIEVYRAEFAPSSALAAPYVMVAMSVFAADAQTPAERMLTSAQQQFVALRRGQGIALPPPVESMEGLWSSQERAMVDEALSCAVIGTPDTIRSGIRRFVTATRADEILLTGQIYDHAARLRSFEIAAAACRELELAPVAAGR